MVVNKSFIKNLQEREEQNQKWKLEGVRSPTSEYQEFKKGMHEKSEGRNTSDHPEQKTHISLLKGSLCVHTHDGA